MKKIEAIFREEKLDAVKNALEAKGYYGMTVSQVKVEIVVLDEDLIPVMHALAASARTGDIGDGKIFVLPVYDALRIRTGDAGADAV
jgi:nitrogen regulatory protein P-II 1